MRGADRERESERAMSKPISIEPIMPAPNMPHAHRMRVVAPEAEEVSWTLTPLGDSAKAVIVRPIGSVSSVMRLWPGTRIR